MSSATMIPGVVVQLVRIHACHAWGRGFESRPFRTDNEAFANKNAGAFFHGLHKRYFSSKNVSEMKATLHINDDKWRVPVETEYLISLGRALYHFTYLEKTVVDLIRKLQKEEIPSLAGNETANDLKCILNSCLKVNKDLAEYAELKAFNDLFEIAIREGRNFLLHSQPCTDSSCEQSLLYRAEEKGTKPFRIVEWPLSEVDRFALKFQEIAIEGNRLYYLPSNKPQ